MPGVILLCRCVVQVSQVSKLLKYLSTLSTATSDDEPVARADLLSNTSGLTGYYNKLSGPPVSYKCCNMIYITYCDIDLTCLLFSLCK